MNIATKIYMEEAEQRRVQTIRNLEAYSEITRAFIGWMLRDISSFKYDFETIWSNVYRLQEIEPNAKHVATLGYAISVLPVIEDKKEKTSECLKWMSGRQPFRPNTVPTFETDGIILLGLAIGARTILSQPFPEIKWLCDLIDQALTKRLDSWNRILIETAAACVNDRCISSESLNDAPDAALALMKKGLIQINDSEQYFGQALKIVCGEPRELSVERAAVQIVLINYLRERALAVQFVNPKVEDVARILDGIRRSLRRWTWETERRTKASTAEKWDIQHEYHVQNLLWFQLASIFDIKNIEDEENLPSLGPKRPRADICLPSLNLIIEVKFMRSGDQAGVIEVIEGVAKAASMYLTKVSGYNKMIAFVWDNSATTEMHQELKQGLLKINGVVDAIIIPRPQKMTLIEQKRVRNVK